MKTFFISFALVCIINLHLFSQLTYQGFLFDKFEKGMIVYKTGGQASAGLFNYDTVNGKVLFIVQDSVIFELARTDIVLELRILDRTFSHVGNGIFYEKIGIGEHDLYVRWMARIIYEENESGYGTRPSTGAIDRINQINSTGGSLYKLNTENNHRMLSENVYYLKNGKKYKRIASFDALSKQFHKNCRERIKAYVKKESLDFKKLNDVIKSITFGIETCK